VQNVTRLRIERLGGFVGFGGPHLKSRGELALAELADADRRAIEELFANPPKAEPKSPHPVRYSITRQTPTGSETVNVPEDAVPPVIRDSVKDTLE
jgi:hypothetical protein